MFEQWGSANDSIFFARQGDLAGYYSENQEMSRLSLHLLQNCLADTGTLMVQQVLAKPEEAEAAEHGNGIRSSSPT